MCVSPGGWLWVGTASPDYGIQGGSPCCDWLLTWCKMTQRKCALLCAASVDLQSNNALDYDTLWACRSAKCWQPTASTYCLDILTTLVCICLMPDGCIITFKTALKEYLQVPRYKTGPINNEFLRFSDCCTDTPVLSSDCFDGLLCFFS